MAHWLVRGLLFEMDFYLTRAVVEKLCSSADQYADDVLAGKIG